MALFGKRAIAYILDFFVVSAFMWIFSYLAYFFNAIFIPYLIPIKSTINPAVLPGYALLTLEIVWIMLCSCFKSLSI